MYVRVDYVEIVNLFDLDLIVYFDPVKNRSGHVKV